MDSIIRDLTDSAMKLVRQREIAKNRARAEDATEELHFDASSSKKSVGRVENHDSPVCQAFPIKIT